MSHPSDAIQAAIFSRLNGNAGIATALGGAARIYDRVPAKPVFPYITIGNEQLVDDGNTCDRDRFDVFFDVHVWTDSVGLPQAKRIAAAVHDAILLGLTITGWRVVILSYETERHFTDSDGLRGHGVVSFRINIETA
jgi:Protein of unknown function (DUF3168)